MPEYVTTGYQASNAAKALRARFEGKMFLSWYVIIIMFDLCKTAF